MVKCSVEFHELYGLSLNIQDIDTAYTIGELARKREEILLRLEQEGVLTMNQDLPLPIVLQKIAVISSETAAGFEARDEPVGSPMLIARMTRVPGRPGRTGFFCFVSAVRPRTRQRGDIVQCPREGT